MKPCVRISSVLMLWFCVGFAVLSSSLTCVLCMKFRNTDFLFLERFFPQENRGPITHHNEFPVPAFSVRVEDLSDTKYRVWTNEYRFFNLPDQESDFLNDISEKSENLVYHSMVSRHKYDALSKMDIFIAPHTQWVHVYAVMERLGAAGFTDVSFFVAQESKAPREGITK